jgi:hypothetical protein
MTEIFLLATLHLANVIDVFRRCHAMLNSKQFGC